MDFTKTCIFFKSYPRAGDTTDCQDHFQTVWTNHSDHSNRMYSCWSHCQDFLTLSIIPSYAEDVQHKHYNCIVEFQFFASVQHQVSWITTCVFVKLSSSRTGHSTGKHIAVGWGTHVSFYDSNCVSAHTFNSFCFMYYTDKHKHLTAFTAFSYTTHEINHCITSHAAKYNPPSSCLMQYAIY